MQMAKMAIPSPFHEDKKKTKNRQSCRVVNTTATQFAISEAEAKSVDPGAVGIPVGSPHSVPTLASIRTLIGRTQLYSFLIQDTQGCLSLPTPPKKRKKKLGRLSSFWPLASLQGKLSWAFDCPVLLFRKGPNLCAQSSSVLERGVVVLFAVFSTFPPPQPPKLDSCHKATVLKKNGSSLLSRLYLKMFNLLVWPIFLGTED
uniref:Uncharacterized protein n=1 Tax=Micrurus paraensis TaxID=1970185 RepID=A0A2D4JYQ3_9SAUR